MRNTRARPLPSKEEILELFTYNKDEGSLYNKKGKRLITKTTLGYNVVKIQGKLFYAHRIIFFLETGEEPEHIDHIDRNPLNNHISNLRAVSKSQNNQNKPKSYGGSKYKGVSWCQERKKWVAQLMKNGKSVLHKRFETEEEAALAYNKAVSFHYGEFGYFNDIEKDV